MSQGDGDAVVLGRRVDDFVDAEMATQIRDEDRRVIETGEASRCEEILRQPDGPHVFLTTKNALESADGRRIGIVGVARDVTLERLLEADRERLYKIEHRLAETLQQAMLGNAELDDDRMEVYARYQPALEELTVGGDWYDIVSLPNDMIGLIVGDAVGRGIDAATAMGQLRSALTALALAGLDPASALEAVEAFARTIPGAHSATCLYVVVDPSNAQLLYSVAGHMPPLVVAGDGTTEYLDGQQDPHSRRPASIVPAGPVASRSPPARRSCSSPTVSSSGGANRSTSVSTVSRPRRRPPRPCRSARCAITSSTRSSPTSSGATTSRSWRPA